MRKWWKKLGIVAGGLVGMGGLLSPAHAQFGPPPGPGGPPPMFAGEPTPPQAPDFPNPGAPSSEGVSPFSLTNDGSPNAWTSDAPAAGQGYRFTMRAEYINYIIPKVNVPIPLVTTSLAPNLQTDFGQLGQPNTRIVFGPDNIGYGNVPGGRATMGFAIGPIPPIEVSGMALNRNLTLFNQTSDGTANAPVLARPVNITTQPNILGSPSAGAFLVSFPTLGNGTIGMQSHFNTWSTDVDFFVPLGDTGTFAVDFIFGYKYAEINEEFNIGEHYLIPGSQFNNLPNGTPNGFITSITDNFATGNRYNGGTIGFRSRITYSALSLMADLKLSMGMNHQVLNVTGVSTLTGAGSHQSLPGGILALNSNGGETTRNVFTVIPEANVFLSCQLTKNLRVFGGYNLLNWSSWLRPADQLDMRIDPRQVPTDQTFIRGFRGNAPLTNNLSSTSFFASGFSIGVEFGF